jgi:hypothetical protein
MVAQMQVGCPRKELRGGEWAVGEKLGQWAEKKRRERERNSPYFKSIFQRLVHMQTKFVIFI